MPSLKELRNRIGSVKQTQKITSAMKLVAASKLKRAQEQAEAARPFAERMATMLTNLAASVATTEGAPPLLAGSGKAEVHLLIVATADRGLCGGFNSSIVRGARARIRALREEGRQVKLLCVGRKGRDILRREYGELIVGTIEGVGRRRLEYAEAVQIAERINAMYEAGEFDVATIVYNRFRSAITQVLTLQQLIPVQPAAAEEAQSEVRAVYEFEPDEEAILRELLPRNLAVQIYGALVENAASEQGARMTAMDNATRNAGEMIESLSLFYNRTRQAQITRELIEIVSGAEAL
ncbi:MAG TPA: F0F1 ATP synthase subunit gamma [Geminicoccaceae bacterium]|nr:F0F1 ATP synthase subunit gamma [Geminicoccaceae bacterium]